MFKVIPRGLSSFLWISPPRTLSFSLFLYVFKPSMLTIYSTLLYEGGRLYFDPDGVQDDAGGV